MLRITSKQALDQGFVFINKEIVNYYGGKTDLVIPQQIGGVDVVRIFDGAFKGKGLKSVTIPKTVSEIGYEAFADNELSELKLPRTVKLIGDRAFANNKIEEDLELEDSIEHIGDEAFSNAIKGRVFVDCRVEIFRNTNPFTNNEGIAFYYEGKEHKDLIMGTNLVSGSGPVVHIPRGVETIFRKAFKGIQLEEVKIPPTVKFINELAFSETNMTEIFLEGQIDFYSADCFPQGTKVFGPRYPKAEKVFGDLYTIVEKDLNEHISIDEAYDMGLVIDNQTGEVTSCRELRGELKFPLTIGGVEIKSIAASAFLSHKLTKVYLPDTLISIGDSAFQSNRIYKLRLPNNLEEIGRASFALNELSSLTIPENVKQIKSQAFSWNPLMQVTLNNQELDDATFNGKTHRSFVFDVPEESRYKGVTHLVDKIDNKLVFSKRGYIREQYSEIVDGAMTDVNDELVYIPNGVTKIGSKVLARSKVRVAYLPPSVTDLAEDAFAEANSSLVILLAEQTSKELVDKIRKQGVTVSMSLSKYPAKPEDKYASYIFNS